MRVSRPLSAAILIACAGPVTAADITWGVHIGLWSAPGNWIGGVPSAGDNVFVTDVTRLEHVTIDVTASINALTLSEFGLGQIADSITLQNNRMLSITGGGFLNDGHFNLESSGNLTTLSFVGAQTVAGRGEIVMSDNGNNRITTNNTVLQHGNGFGHEIRGAGRLLDNTGGLWNRSTIRQQGTNALVVDPNGQGVDNDGLMVAEGSGGLSLINGTFDNTGGEIRAADQSRVLVSGATINGGTLSTLGSGVFDVTASIFDGVTNLGVVEQANNTQVTIHNGLLHNGTWSLNSTGNLTSLFFNGAQTVSGTGTIVMGDAVNNRLINNNTVTTVGAGITVRGAGRLLDNTGGLVNQGTIIAEGGNALVIDPNGNGFVQDGVLRAAGPGGLQLINGTFDLNNPLDVTAGSALFVSGAILNTGTLDIANGVAANIQSSTLSSMTINGDVVQANNLTNTITNGLTLNGTWSLNSTGNLTSLLFSGAQTVSGTGTIVMGDAVNNRLINNNTVTTIGSGITVRGAGRLLDNSGGLVNQGTIVAEGGNALVIDPNGLGFVQNGVLRAAGPGGLQLINGTFDLNNPLDVMAGSALFVSGAILNAGTLDIANGVAANIQSSTLNGMTINGDVAQGNNLTNTILNGLTVNGTWSLNSGGNLTSLLFNGAQTVSGTGTIVMGDAVNNRLLNNNTVTTIGTDLTVRGAGRLLDNSGGMINQGTIIAEGGNALVIDPNGLGFVQNGVLRAAGSGGLHLFNGTFDLNNPLDVMAGSALFVSGATLDTGVLEIANGVVADIRTSTLDAMTINGDVAQGNNLTNTILNGLTVNGTWSLNSGGNLTSLFFNGAQTLGGNGTVILGDNGANRLINNNTVTTIDAGLTVRGAGRLLDNLGGMINQGTIIAEGGNALVIDPNGLGFIHNGVLRAAGSGGLHLVGGTFDLNNPLDVMAGSALLVSGARLNTGTLEIANGVVADIRTSTLDAMTINGDVAQGNNLTNTILNGLTVNGTWSLNSGGSLTSLFFNGAQTLGGNGTVILGDNGANRLFNNNTVTTIGADLTVRGAGRLLDNLGGMVNQGTIIAEGSNALVINPNALGFENRGLVQALGAGGIKSADDYRQTAGATVVESVFDITNRTLIVDGGTLSGSGTIIGDVDNNAGVVGPGSSPGTLTIDGDFTQGAAGELLIEIAGLGDFDVLSISGSAILGGDIAVNLLGGYVPLVGESFDVLLASDINGIFANGQFVDAGLAVFEIVYLDGAGNDIVRLTTVSAVPLPAGAWLLLSALGGLLVRGHRRARH